MLREIRENLESGDPVLRMQAFRELIADSDITDLVKKMILKDLMNSDADDELCEKAAKYYDLYSRRDNPDEEGDSDLNDYAGEGSPLTGDDARRKTDFLKAVLEDREVISRKTLLTHMACETNPTVLAYMLECLGHIGKPKDARFAIAFLKDRVSLVRAAAVKALDKLNNEKTFNRIIIMLQDPDQSVVAAADHFVQSLGQKRLMELLDKMVNSSKLYNIDGAIYILYRTPTQEAKDLLEKANKRKEEL